MTVPLVYLDIETTGLNPFIHEVWEVAYAFDDEPIQVFELPHSLVTADPAALRVNRYVERHPSSDQPTMDMVMFPRPPARPDLALKEALYGCTIVGANPAFDTSFLSYRWRGERPWSYRLIDIEVYAQAIFDWERPRGLAGVVDALNGRGYSIVQPDHTAFLDVTATRDAYRALRDIAADRVAGERE